MTDDKKHSPTPWRVATADEWGSWIDDVHGREVGAEDIGEANAAHIVRCVNAHDDLVAALTALLERYERETASLPRTKPWMADDEVIGARAALKKAGE